MLFLAKIRRALAIFDAKQTDGSESKPSSWPAQGVARPCQHACRVVWDEDILAHPAMKEVIDSNGQVILKGMSAAIGICHGPVIKVCPHTTTGECAQLCRCPLDQTQEEQKVI